MRELIEKLAEKTLLTEEYSHYWKHDGFDDDEWKKLMSETKKIIKSAAKDGVKLAGPSGSGKPEIDGKHIGLNGSEADGDDYETFWLDKKPAKFEFAKTGQKPYDAVVVSILAAAKKINRKFKPSSDGGPTAIKRVY